MSNVTPVDVLADFDSKRAQAEGWDLFHVDLGDEIELQADNNVGIFDDDAEAVKFVQNQAKQGSAFHADALRRVTVTYHTDKQVVDKAQDQYASGDVMIDNDACVDRTEDGYWIDARVWVPKADFA